jgi:hypothetical protein
MQSNVAKEFAVPIWTFHGRLRVARFDPASWKAFASGFSSETQLRQLVSKEGISCEGSCVLPRYHSVPPNSQDLINVMALLGSDMCKSAECIRLLEAEKAVEDRGTFVEVRKSFQVAGVFVTNPCKKNGKSTLLDFGMLTVMDSRRMRLNITNLNPRDIKLHRFTSDLPSVRVKFEFLHHPATNQIVLLENLDQGSNMFSSCSSFSSSDD